MFQNLYKFNFKKHMDQLRPEPPTQMKKQNSYTYWVDPNNKSRQLPPEHQPKKLQKPIAQNSNQQGPSAWNAMGTWEEKKIPLTEINSSLTEKLKQLMSKAEFEGIELDQVKLEGDAYKVYKKNKWTVMYEIHGHVGFKKQQAKGKLKVTELTNIGVSQRQFETSGSSELKKALSPNADNMIKLIEQIMSKYNS